MTKYNAKTGKGIHWVRLLLVPVWLIGWAIDLLRKPVQIA